jgi:hypothetical protein
LKIIIGAAMRAKGKTGWDVEGRSCTVLGEPVFVLQNWTPVLWDDEEDPTFVKSAALEIEETKPVQHTTRAIRH